MAVAGLGWGWVGVPLAAPLPGSVLSAGAVRGTAEVAGLWTTEPPGVPLPSPVLPVVVGVCSCGVRLFVSLFLSLLVVLWLFGCVRVVPPLFVRRFAPCCLCRCCRCSASLAGGCVVLAACRLPLLCCCFLGGGFDGHRPIPEPRPEGMGSLGSVVQCPPWGMGSPRVVWCSVIVPSRSGDPQPAAVAFGVAKNQ